MSSSMSSQTFVAADTPWIHNPRPHYSYNFRHRLGMADSLKTINQELLQPKDWVSPTIPNWKKEFAKQPTIDILIIGAAPFNTLMQQASHAKSIEIFSILICDIEKVLASKSITDPAKKLLAKYHNFFNLFSRADSDILAPQRPYDHKILLIKDKTLPWGFLYNMSQDKLKVLKKYLEENLSKGLSRLVLLPPCLPYILFINQKVVYDIMLITGSWMPWLLRTNIFCHSSKRH